MDIAPSPRKISLDVTNQGETLGFNIDVLIDGDNYASVSSKDFGEAMKFAVSYLVPIARSLRVTLPDLDS